MFKLLFVLSLLVLGFVPVESGNNNNNNGNGNSDDNDLLIALRAIIVSANQTLSARINSIQTSINNHQSSINSIQATVAAQQTAITNNLANINTHTTSIAALQSTVHNQQTAILNLETGLTNTNTQAASQATQISALVSGLSSAQSSIASSQSSITSLNDGLTSTNTQVTGHDAQIHTLQSQLATALASIVSLQSTVNNLLTTTSAQQTSISNLQTSSAAQIGALQTAVASVNASLNIEKMRAVTAENGLILAHSEEATTLYEDVSNYLSRAVYEVCEVGDTRSVCNLQTSVGPVVRLFYLTISNVNIAGKMSVAANGTVPGPPIIVNQYDIVEVIVTNLLSVGSAIHWHGQLQHGTTFADGVPGLTQCPIPSGSTFTYRFVASIPGTFWYHGHIYDQYPDGLIGSFLINRVPEGQTTPEEYLRYQEDHTLLFNDYLPVPAATYFPDSAYTGVNTALRPLSNATQIMVNGLLDPTGGTGAYARAYTTQSIGLKYNLKSNTRQVRIRLINASAKSLISFWFEGMNSTLIELDGEDVVPSSVSNILNHAAQRASVLLDLDFVKLVYPAVYAQGFVKFYLADAVKAAVANTPAAFVLNGLNINPCSVWGPVTSATSNPPTTSTGQACLPVRWGYFIFPNNDLTLPNVAPFFVSGALARDLIRTGYALDSTNGVHVNHLDVYPQRFNPAPNYAQVTHRLVLVFNGATAFNGFSFPETLFDVNPPYMFPFYKVNVTANPHQATVFNTTFDTVTDADGKILITGSSGVYKVPYNSIVQVELITGGSHPFHLHGHKFWVIGGDAGTLYNNYIQRDVVTTGGFGGKTIFRFIANNPGVQAMHCHIDWHMTLGLMALLEEAPDKLAQTGISIPEDNIQACRQQSSPYAV